MKRIFLKRRKGSLIDDSTKETRKKISLKNFNFGGKKPFIKKRIDTLIISDAHLASDESRAEELLKLLGKFRFKRLIFPGDTFDAFDLNRLTHSEWQLLNHVREISENKKLEIVWITGNHDEGLAEILENIGIRAKVQEEYIWKYKGKIHFATHGHQFDAKLNNQWIGNLASFIFNLIQKIERRLNVKNQSSFSRYIKKFSRIWLNYSRKVAERAIEYSKRHGANHVFIGHTHKEDKVEIDGIECYNSGCFGSNAPTYITISKKGIRIREYP